MKQPSGYMNPCISRHDVSVPQHWSTSQSPNFRTSELPKTVPMSVPNFRRPSPVVLSLTSRPSRTSELPKTVPMLSSPCCRPHVVVPMSSPCRPNFRRPSHVVPVPREFRRRPSPCRPSPCRRPHVVLVGPQIVGPRIVVVPGLLSPDCCPRIVFGIVIILHPNLGTLVNMESALFILFVYFFTFYVI